MTLSRYKPNDNDGRKKRGSDDAGSVFDAILKTSPVTPSGKEEYYQEVANREPLPCLAPIPPNDSRALYIGHRFIPLKTSRGGNYFEGNSVILGAPQSGKTNIFRVTAAHGYSFVRPGSGMRTITLDAKGEAYPTIAYFAEKEGVPLVFINLTDERASAWHIARDIEGMPDRLHQLINILMPPPRYGEAFFAQAAAMIAEAVALTIMRKRDENWGIHDVYRVCRAALPQFREFLLSDSRNDALLDRMFNSTAEKTRDSVLQQLSVSLVPFALAAAHQARTPMSRWTALRDFREGHLLIGDDPQATYSSGSFIRAMFQVIVDQGCGRLGDNRPIDTFVFLDELPYLCNSPSGDVELPGLMTMLRFLRGKGFSTHLTTQSFDDLERIFGKSGAESLLNCCNYKVLMRCNSEASAKYAVSVCGEFWETEWRRSVSMSPSGTTWGMTEHIENRNRFTTGYFLHTLQVADPTRGIDLVLITPQLRTPAPIHVPAEEVDYWKPPSLDIEPIRRKPAYMREVPLMTRDEVEQFLRDIRSTSPSWLNEYLGVAQDPFERAIRKNVYEMLNTIVDEGVGDYLEMRGFT